MKKTGDMLKKARQEKGLSLHEIGLSLKINSKVLKAIEDGDPEGLPAKTFLRGFVQSYAQYLRLNNDEVMALFTEEMGSTRPSPLVKSLDPDAPLNPLSEKTSSSEPSPLENPKLYQSNEFKIKPFLYGFVILILVGLIYMVKKVVDRYQREAITETVQVVNPLPELPSPPPAQAASSTATATTSSVQVAKPSESLPLETTHSNVLKLAIPSPATPEKKPDVEIRPSEAKNTEAKIPEPKPPEMKSAAPKPPESKSITDKLPDAKLVEAKVKPEIKPETKSEAKPETKLEAKAEAKLEAKRELKPTDKKPIEPSAEVAVKAQEIPPVAKKPEVKSEEKAKAKPVELIVEAMDAVEIEYSSLSGKSGKLKLAADQVHTFKSSSGLKLNIDNGGAVNLILNGKDIGVPGSLGKPLRLSY